MLRHLAHAVHTAWDDLPDPDKGLVTAATLLFGTLFLLLVSATLFLGT